MNRMTPETFRTLIETHQKMVFSIALRVTGDPGIAEEVAQDVFLELYRSADKLESEDHIRFWLRRVSVHRATDAIRRRSRRPEAVARNGPRNSTSAIQRKNWMRAWNPCISLIAALLIGCGEQNTGVSPLR